MASTIPTTMRAIALDKFSNPSEYNLANLPVPKMENDDDILIKIHAASVNPVDVKMASPSIGKVMDTKAQFPYKLGYDVSGTIVSTGSSVQQFRVGDAVYSRVPSSHRGTLAEYVTVPAFYVAHKPSTIDHVAAASIPLAAQTAFQALKQADETLAGGLAGKTVLIPAGLSGTGSFGVQIAKNYFKAGKVITTLSPGKMSTFNEIIGQGVADQVIDYTKGNASVAQEIGKANVDFMFDTMGQTISLVSTIKPKTGLALSISLAPNGTQMVKISPGVAWYMKYVLNVADFGITSYLTRWWDIKYSYLILEPNGEDLESLKGMVERGELKPIVGDVVGLEDLEGVRRGCQRVMDGKGGVGKFVVEVVKS